MKLNNENLICSVCDNKFTWDGGNDSRGNIYECEDECGRHICVSCILESKQYHEELEELKEDGFGIAELEKIQCLTCKDNQY